MRELTPMQEQVLAFIQREELGGRPAPTHREIARHFGFRSSRAAACHLDALRRKGMLASDAGKARSLRVTTPLARLRNAVMDIPLLGSIPAGAARDAEQDPAGCVTVDVESVGFKPNRNTFALRVSGDSMIGRHILHGDIVLLEHGVEPRSGQIVAALIDRQSTLKTFILKNGKPYLKAENPKYPTLIPSEELMIQGVFKALIRRDA